MCPNASHVLPIAVALHTLDLMQEVNQLLGFTLYSGKPTRSSLQDGQPLPSDAGSDVTGMPPSDTPVPPPSGAAGSEPAASAPPGSSASGNMQAREAPAESQKRTVVIAVAVTLSCVVLCVAIAVAAALLALRRRKRKATQHNVGRANGSAALIEDGGPVAAKSSQRDTAHQPAPERWHVLAYFRRRGSQHSGAAQSLAATMRNSAEAAAPRKAQSQSNGQHAQVATSHPDLKTRCSRGA